MVEVFKTNIKKKTERKILLRTLADAFPTLKINIDLLDCDKILRVEGNNIQPSNIMVMVKERGFRCEKLD